MGGAILDLKWSPDGTRFISHSKAGIRLWSPNAKRHICNLHVPGGRNRDYTAVDWSYDGNYIMVSEIQGGVFVFDGSK